MHAEKQMQNFHVPLPKSLYEALREEADKSSAPATQLAREAIETLLRERKRQRIAEEIRAFAEQHAATPLDLDEELEQAAVEHLLDDQDR